MKGGGARHGKPASVYRTTRKKLADTAIEEKLARLPISNKQAKLPLARLVPRSGMTRESLVLYLFYFFKFLFAYPATALT